jgi:hypothetical protein
LECAQDLRTAVTSALASLLRLVLAESESLGIGASLSVRGDAGWPSKRKRSAAAVPSRPIWRVGGWMRGGTSPRRGRIPKLRLGADAGE